MAASVVSLCLLASFAVAGSLAFPRMLRGRPFGGMLGEPPVDKSVKLPEAQWFAQRLNHFDDSNTRTWQQRFFVNDSFFHKKDGPVFLMIGGEGAASPRWMVTGSWIQYAQDFGALAFMLEHRFYGESHPTSDMSDENLKFLNSEQALADLAAFRQAMAEKYNLTTNKWLAFGGSYPGSLSAWFRLKYPHLVDGSVATSAPVRAQLDFPEYLEVVSASLSTTGPECVQNIANATQKVDSLLGTDEGTKQLSQMFKLCTPLDKSNANDVASFSSSLAGNFMGVVQYNKDNRVFEGAVGTNITIETLCGIMKDSSVGDALSRYAQVNALLLSTYGESCLDVSYKELISMLQNTTWQSAAAEGGRQWTYQTCTEFGFYQTTDSDQQPFGKHFSLNFYIQQCMDIFGEEFNRTNIENGVKQTNTNYGAKGIASNKIVFPNGSIDPWHALGIVKDVSPSEQAVYIKGTAHCANMYPPSPDDPPQLIEARELVRKRIQEWLA